MREAGDWIDAFLDYTKNTEPPYLYRKWTAISTIASALQRKCWLKRGRDMIFYPNMYIVLVGPAGRVKKGTAMSYGERLLREVGIKLSSHDATKQGLIEQLLESTAIETLSTGDVITHTSLTIHASELTVFLGYKDTEFLTILTKWFDCEDNFEYRTRSHGPEVIANIWVNLIGATVPDMIQTALPREAIGGGFSSRVIFVYEDQKGNIQPLPEADDTDENAVLWDAMRSDLNQIYKLQGQFRLASDALMLYADWYTDLERNPPILDPNFQGYLGRRPTHLQKVAQIMSASRGNDMIITKADLERSIETMEEVEQKMTRVFSGFGSARNSGVSARLMDFIAAKGTTSERELMQIFSPEFESIRVFRELIELLKAQGFLEEHTQNGSTLIKFRTTYANAKAYQSVPSP